MTAPLQLQTPAVHDYQNPTLERREAVVRRELSRLPLLNLVRSVPELGRVIPLLVREPLTASERLRLLELYRVPMNGVTMAAENRRLRQLPISAAARQQLKEEILALCHELANGYKIVVKELLERGRQPPSEPLLVTALHRALEQLRNALLHSYRIYRAIPANHFLELHQLHHFAARHGVARRPLPIETTNQDDGTIELVYKRAMLLAIADPYRLVDGAIEQLYRFLGEGLSNIGLQPGTSTETRRDGLFLVRADSDLPPVIYGRAPLDRPGSDPYTIDTTALIGELAGDPGRAATGQGNPGSELLLATFAKWLLPRLRLSWERQQPRQQVDKKAFVATGFGAACYLLSPAGREAVSTAGRGGCGIEVQELAHQDDDIYALEQWSVLNESLNGFLLCRPEQPGLEIRIGDLLLVQQAGDNGRYTHPVVTLARRIGVKDGALQVGVEILPGQPAAVSVHAEASDGGRQSHAALYLPAIKQLNIPPTLVTAKGVHAVSRKLVIDTGPRRVAASCGELLLHTELVEQFRVGRDDEG